MSNRLLALLVLALLALTAACGAGQAAGGVRLPTPVPPGQAQPGQVPAGQPTVAIQVLPPGPGSLPAQPGQNPVPAAPLPTFPPQPTSSLPTATPLPGATVIGATGDATALRRPISLALADDGTLYVGDQLGIHQFDANGKYVKTLYKTGPETGMRLAAALALAPNGELYAADTFSNLIYRLKTDGTLVGKIGEGEVRLDGPVALEFDPQGNLFIINQNAGEVLKLDPSGKLLMKVGTKGEQNGQFLRPRGMTLDKDGNIYVTDLTTFHIQKFDKTGKYIRTFGDQHAMEQGWFLRGIDIGPDGRLYVVDGAQQRIQIFELTNFSLVKDFQNPGREPGQLQDPEDMLIDKQGYLYIADKGNNRVQKLKLSF